MYIIATGYCSTTAAATTTVVAAIASRLPESYRPLHADRVLRGRG